MTMLKFGLTGVLFCATLSAINAEENATITRDIKLTRPFSTTIMKGSHLVTVSSNRTHVVVNSTDELMKPCEIMVDRVEHPIQRKAKATMLRDKIIVWGVRAKYDKAVNGRTRIDYTVIIVDPKQCTYKPVVTYEEEARWFDSDKNLPEVVAHDDNFNVFYFTSTSCAPCRYSIDGKRIDLKNHIESEPLESSASSHVVALNAPGLKDGYFYAHNYENKKSVIKLFDHDLNLIKQKPLEHPVDAVATNSGEHPSITTCYMSSIKVNELNTEKVNCERYDANFESVFSTHLPLLQKHDPEDVSVAVDSSGNSLISVVESDKQEELAVFRLYKLNSIGQVVNTVRLGEVPRKRFFYGGWRLRGLVSDGQYCIEILKLLSPWDNPWESDGEYIKCVVI